MEKEMHNVSKGKRVVEIGLNVRERVWKRKTSDTYIVSYLNTVQILWFIFTFGF